MQQLEEVSSTEWDNFHGAKNKVQEPTGLFKYVIFGREKLLNEVATLMGLIHSFKMFLQRN